MRDIRVATVQFQSAAGDKPYNLRRVARYVTAAARSDARIIAFPEMCFTGYWHVRKLSHAAFAALAEPVPDGMCTRELLRLSREHQMTIGAGLLERAIAETRVLGDDMVVADLDASLLPTSSGRRWLKARRPELYASLAQPTGQEIETRRVRFGP